MENNELIIDIKSLNKSFDGKPAVINLDLQVKRGEIFGFLGPNGSGKTTTIRMICGLLTPDSGEGHCLGYDILKESNKIKLQVGYMTQRFTLYDDLSIEENLDFIAQLYKIPNRKKAVPAALEDLNLTERRKQLAGTLSGGWKQRLALSAALIHKPKLLLLDEPTGGVDPASRRDFWDKVHDLSLEGITTLVSTHYMDEAERCTHLAYIANGRLLTKGTSTEIIKNSGLTTWQLTGKDVLNLADKIRKLPAVEQVAAFGTALHISSKDPIHLKESLNTIPNVERKIIPTSLEDVFIALVTQLKRGDGNAY